MTDYKFTNDNITSKRVEKFIDKIDFSYHINTFDYTTMHGHDDYWEFTLLTEGKLNNVLNGQKISVTAGQMFFSTTDDTHYLKKVGSGKIRYINIIARESAIKRLADMFSDSFFTTLQKMSRKQTFPTELTTQVEEIIHQMLLLPEDAYKEYDGLLCGAVMIVMQFLYRKSVDFIRMEILLRIKRLIHFHSERVNLERITTSYITIEIHEVFLVAYKSRQTVKHGNDSSFAGIPADIRYKVSKTIIP